MVKRSEKSGVDKAKKPTKAKAVKALLPPEKPPTTQAEINRIGDIIRNARGTWFGLLGALVFAAVTLASVKDASFFIPSEETKLPLLGISVPITSFFWAGALLVTALYTYLHLYLVQLWDALGDADPQFEGKPLADVIHPWLVSDAALRVRDWLREERQHKLRTFIQNWNAKKRFLRSTLLYPIRQLRALNLYAHLLAARKKEGEPSSRSRGMSWVSTLVSILLVWFFGLITIGFFWWRSLPSHDIWLTGWLGALFAWSLFIFWRSVSYVLERLGNIKYPFFPNLILYGTCVLIIGTLSFLRIYVLPARAEMAETVFTQKPASWKGYDLAKQEFRKNWCKQIVEKVCEINPLDENPLVDEKVEKKFEEAWKIQLKATLATFSKPDLRGKRLEGADLRSAQLEGVSFRSASLQGANFSNAKMQGAYLRNAKLQNSKFSDAEMQGADLWGAEMEDANFSNAKMQDADLRLTRLHRVDFSYAKMQGVQLEGTMMPDADLRNVVMQDVDLISVYMTNVNLSGAQVQGTPEKIMKLQSTILREANFSASSLRFVDFTGADVADLRNFETSFGDGSVKLAGKIATPDGWCEKTLSDEQYWGRYQGWFKKHKLGSVNDEEITQYPLIPFGTPCPE